MKKTGTQKSHLAKEQSTMGQNLMEQQKAVVLGKKTSPKELFRCRFGQEQMANEEGRSTLPPQS